MQDILFSFFNAFWLFIWFNTEAFLEYIKYLPKIRDLFKIKEFKEYQLKAGVLTYPTYLQVYYNNFLTRLISCPYCLLFWINLSTIGLLMNVYFFFVNYVISVVIYYILRKITNE
jgi:hypothetical protein